MASSHVVFDGYSYEPPSYEEAQAQGRLSQSVYKPTVLQIPNVVMGGLRPLYVPGGYNGLSEYNAAKRQRKVRVAYVTLISLSTLMLVILLVWNASYFYPGSHYGSSYYGNNEDSAASPSYEDSSVISNNDDDRKSVNDDHKQEQLPNESAFDKTEPGEHNDDPVNNGNDFIVSASKIVSDAIAYVEKNHEMLKQKLMVSSSENPVTSTENVTRKPNYLDRFKMENLIKEGIIDPETGRFDEEKARQFIYTIWWT